MKETNRTVCVTGAGGFIASWLVKMLLKRGYTVRGVVRTNPNDDGWKYAHLRALEGAKEKLELVRADILDYQSLVVVIRGCHGVFHVATAMSNNPEEVIAPEVKGTKNMMEVCAEMGVKRVVFTSSIGAVYMDPHRNPFAKVDEDCWSNLDYCIQTSNWYCYAKTLAERSAWELAKKLNLELVVLIPGMVLGSNLNPSIDVGTAHIMKYLTGRCSDQINVRKQPYEFSNQKLKDLNFSFTPVIKSVADTVESLHKKGLLQRHLSGWDDMDRSHPLLSRI